MTSSPVSRGRRGRERLSARGHLLLDAELSRFQVRTAKEKVTPQRVSPGGLTSRTRAGLRDEGEIAVTEGEKKVLGHVRASALLSACSRPIRIP